MRFSGPRSDVFWTGIVKAIVVFGYVLVASNAWISYRDPASAQDVPARSDCSIASGDYVVVDVGWDDPIGGLAVRAAPNGQAPIKGVIPAAGTDIEIGVCRENGWCEVHYECIAGWSLANRFTAPRGERLYRVANVAPDDPEGLNMRVGPGGNNPTKRSIPYDAVGIVLHAYQPDGGWCLVTYGNAFGWTARRFLTPMTLNATGTRVHEAPTARLESGAPGGSRVSMVSDGGTFKVPVTINGQLTLKFVVDSGASDVMIPADVVLTLVRAETITEADFLDQQTLQLADGTTLPSQRFVIRSLKVGDRVLENVAGSVAPVAGSLLLGQSFLTRFKSWSIDNQRQALILN
jgi:clan AA aspartic protease (TIGR02281 family)